MNRILIVEDEVPIAQLIEMSLARAGYQCEAVNDGCAAADKIEQNNYDLVLLDIMPRAGRL
ncbi:MAG: response regulator transcription factor [Ruthenibacterium lactatiformans]